MATNSDTAHKLTIVKSFTYRGHEEEFSNSYHFTGDLPADSAAWDALSSAIMLGEHTCYPSDVRIMRCYGYEAGQNLNVYTRPLGDIGDEFPGSLTAPTLAQRNPGDAAVWLRWATPDLTDPGGKRIYLRKYFHPAISATDDADSIWATQKTAMMTFGALMTSGDLPDSRLLCGPTGAAAGTHAVGPYITTRTLKRRGKRPPTSG